MNAADQCVDMLNALHDAGRKLTPGAMEKLALILSEQVREYCDSAIPHDDSRALVSYMDFMGQLPANVENAFLEYEAIAEIVGQREHMADVTSSVKARAGWKYIGKGE